MSPAVVPCRLAPVLDRAAQHVSSRSDSAVGGCDGRRAGTLALRYGSVMVAGNLLADDEGLRAGLVIRYGTALSADGGGPTLIAILSASPRRPTCPGRR